MPQTTFIRKCILLTERRSLDIRHIFIHRLHNVTLLKSHLRVQFEVLHLLFVLCPSDAELFNPIVVFIVLLRGWLQLALLWNLLAAAILLVLSLFLSSAEINMRNVNKACGLLLLWSVSYAGSRFVEIWNSVWESRCKYFRCQLSTANSRWTFRK